MLSELGQPVEGPLDGKLLRLESCRTIIDIYATMTVHLGCAFPRGEPSPAVVEILITFPFRHEADEQPDESTNEHHTNDQDAGVWKNIALSHNMSRLADVPLIHLNFTEAGHLDASPPKNGSKAYTNFQILIARKLEKRATQKSLDVPLDFTETAMRHIAKSGQRSETQRLELESIRAAELHCQEQIQTLQKELKDKQLENEGLEREVRRKEAQLWRKFVPARWEEWL